MKVQGKFNVTRGVKILRAGSEKIVGLGGGLQKFVYFKANTRGGWLLKD